MAAEDRAFLRTPLQRALVLLGMYVMVAAMTAAFAAAVTVVVLRVGGFHELDPAGTALRIAAVVLAWELVTCLFWAARRWRGPAGVGILVRTGRSEKQQDSGRWSRAFRWTGGAAALAAAVFGILLLRFPDEPSAPWAAASVVVAIKGLQAAMFSSIKALGRGFERAERAQPANPNLVPVEDILSRPDIAGQHPYEPRHASDRPRIAWRDSVDEFTRVLQRHGVDPAAVTDVAAAWQAFTEFLQIEVSDVDADTDADGFIVQWRRNQWTGSLPTLYFTRQLAVTADEPDTVYWQLSLEMCFGDDADLAGVDGLSTRDTGFRFGAVGPERLADLAGARAEVDRYTPVAAMWRTRPVSSRLTFGEAC